MRTPLPLPDHLQVTCLRAGEAQPLDGVIFHLDVSDVDDSTDEDPAAWRRRPVPRVALQAQWHLPGRWFHLHLPPALVGCTLGAAGELAVPRLVAHHAVETVQGLQWHEEDARIEQLVARRADASRAPVEGFDIELDARLGDGSQWRLQLHGRPLSADAHALEPGGAEAAARALQSLWPGLDLVHDAVETRLYRAGEVAWLRLEWEPAWMPAARQHQWDEAQARERAQRAEREAADAARLAALRSRPVPAPTTTAPLVAARAGHAVARASLRLLQAGDDDARATALVLDIVPLVDDDAGGQPGDDGALCPSLGLSAAPWSVERPLQGEWQWVCESPAEGEAASASSPPAGELVVAEADAWFGNDAPALEHNRLAWRVVSATEAEVDWSADYDDAGTRQRERLRFVGRVVFSRALR